MRDKRSHHANGSSEAVGGVGVNEDIDHVFEGSDDNFAAGIKSDLEFVFLLVFLQVTYGCRVTQSGLVVRGQQGAFNAIEEVLSPSCNLQGIIANANGCRLNVGIPVPGRRKVRFDSGCLHRQSIRPKCAMTYLAFVRTWISIPCTFP